MRKITKKVNEGMVKLGRDEIEKYIKVLEGK